MDNKYNLLSVAQIISALYISLMRIFLHFSIIILTMGSGIIID